MVGEGFVTKEAFGIFSRNLNRRIGALEAGGGGGGGGVGGGGSTFLSLTDTPGSYAGASLKYVRVNSGVSALEFGARMTVSASAPSGGDNGDLWFQYDTDLLVGGTGASGQVAYWTGTSSLTGSNDLLWDGLKLIIVRNVGGAVGPELALLNTGNQVGDIEAITFSSYSYAAKRAQIRSTVEASPYYGTLEFLTGLTTPVERMRITGAGFVGIGTASPGAKLEVCEAAGSVETRMRTNINAQISQVFVRSQSGGSYNCAWYMYVPANSNDLRLYEGADRVWFQADGKVGIGAAPTSPFQVVGLPVYANNAAAVAGGLTAGAFYRNNADPDVVCVVH